MPPNAAEEASVPSRKRVRDEASTAVTSCAKPRRMSRRIVECREVNLLLILGWSKR